MKNIEKKKTTPRSSNPTTNAHAQKRKYGDKPFLIYARDNIIAMNDILTYLSEHPLKGTSKETKDKIARNNELSKNIQASIDFYLDKLSLRFKSWNISE